MPPHIKREKVCPDCGKTYWGTGGSRRCGPCAFARERERNRTTNPKKQMNQIEKNCAVCGVLFQGYRSALYCLPCGAEARERSKRPLGEVCLVAERLVPVPKSSQKVIPPPCLECVYCHPTEEYEAGMACLAEAMLRCQPYRPGAQPLVRKEKV